MISAAGMLTLVGGNEFMPGNEEQDHAGLDAAPEGARLIIPTAAARGHPEQAVRTAQRWFGRMNATVSGLPVLTAADAGDPRLVAVAREGSWFYLAGGDPGLVASVLRGSAVWAAILARWRAGATLAGSSAGAMALCRWTLLREAWPGHTRRRYANGLAVVPGTAVLPHFDRFGAAWLPSARDAAPTPEVTLLGLDEGTAATWSSALGWRAMGTGAVTVVRGADQQVFRSDAAVAGLPEPTRGDAGEDSRRERRK